MNNDKKTLNFSIASADVKLSVEKRLAQIDEKLDRCLNTIREIEHRLVQKDERDINRAIRKFSMKNNTDTPIRFVPNHSVPNHSVPNHSVPLSVLLRSKGTPL